MRPGAHPPNPAELHQAAPSSLVNGLSAGVRGALRDHSKPVFPVNQWWTAGESNP